MILAVDIGITNFGYAVIDNNGPLVTSGTLIFKDPYFPSRLQQIYTSFTKILKGHAISTFVYEDPYFINKGKNTPLIYGCLGILLLISANYNLNTFKFTATEVKKIVTTNGKADKKDIMEAVKNYYPHVKNFSSNHESDAVAVGLSYLKTKLNIVTNIT